MNKKSKSKKIKDLGNLPSSIDYINGKAWKDLTNQNKWFSFEALIKEEQNNKRRGKE